MLNLADAAAAWGREEFEPLLKQSLQQQADALPLQQALARSNAVVDAPITPILYERHEEGGHLHVRVGIFYSGIISGCSCADDPTPNSLLDEYCMLQLDIDRASGATAIRLLNDTP